MPSFVRSAISRRSKCAMAPNTWKISSPAADEVSIFGSVAKLVALRWDGLRAEAVGHVGL
jgi:hypothetical protein